MSPVGLALDGLDDVWVNNGFTNVTVYDASQNLIENLSLSGNIEAIALRGPWFLYSDNIGVWQTLPVAHVLMNNATGPLTSVPNPVVAVAFDSQNNYFLAQTTGEIDHFVNITLINIVSVGYTPSGIALDPVHKRIYVASSTLNKVDVYSTAGTFIATIQ